jgi:hypothetical protein
MANSQLPICLGKIGNWQWEIGNFHLSVTTHAENVSIDSGSSPG